MLHLPDWSRIDLPEHELKIHKCPSVKSALYLPMLCERECIGAHVLSGSRPNIFGDCKSRRPNLPRQAVIAIENARLLNETSANRWNSRRQRRRSFKSSVLLPAIWSLCSGRCWRMPHAFARPIWAHSTSRTASVQLWRRTMTPARIRRAIAGVSPFRPQPDPSLGRMIAAKAVVACRRCSAGTRLSSNAIQYVVAAVELGGVRTSLAVPMLKENEPWSVRYRYFPPGGSPVHGQADRVGARISPPRPSSPSRTRGC